MYEKRLALLPAFFFWGSPPLRRTLSGFVTGEQVESRKKQATKILAVPVACALQLRIA